MRRRLRLGFLVCLWSTATALAQESPAPAPAAAAATPAGQADAPGRRLPDQISDRFEQVTANQWRLSGNVELSIPGSTFKFFADEVDYYLDTSRLVARGNVVFSDGNGRIAADEVEFDAVNGTGTFKNASGSMRIGTGFSLADFAGQDPDVYFRGEIIEKLGLRQYRLTRGAFTTCVQPTPRWEAVSKTVTINLDEYAFARNMVLRVKGVPVLYLPAIYYPIQDDNRATGFLLPSYGTSTLRGQAITNGFFWAISRSQDATLVHDWYTRSGQGVGGEYRYVASDRSQGNVRLYGFSRKETTFTENGETSTLPANNSFQITGTANQTIGSRLRARGYVDYFSDIVTQQLYNQNLYQATQSRRTIEGSLSGTFGMTSMSAHYQRNEYLQGVESSNVYGSTPRISVDVAPQMLFGTRIYGSVDTEFARIADEQLRNGVVISDRTLNQVELAPMLRIPLSRLTYLSANSTASYRTTYYSRSLDASGKLTDAALTRQFLSLRSEFIGPVLTKIWDTPTRATTERMKHVIEPMFIVDYTTEIDNQALVPVLNDPSQYVVGGAARVTYGVTNRLFYRSRPADGQRSQTREFVTIGVNQTYYTNEQSSLFDTSYVSYSRRPEAIDLSPIAVTARFSPTLELDTTARAEYDVSGNGLQIFTVGGTMNTLRTSGNISYSRQRPSPESSLSSYISGSSSLRLRDGRVTGQYSLSWDLARQYVVSQTMAWTYMAQCCGFTAEAQIFSYPDNANVGIPADKRFNFSVVLAGLGSIPTFFGGAFGGGSGR
jgi:LPS-assembly protein